MLAAAKHSLWPAWLVDAVRGVRAVFAWTSAHTLAGVPLDWIVRFVVIGGLYLVLRRRLPRRVAGGIVVALLLVKELFDIVAHQDLLLLRAPDFGDLADILSGLAGVAAAIAIEACTRAGAAAKPLFRKDDLEPGTSETSARHGEPRSRHLR